MGHYHAVLSPSSAARWTDCTASPEAQRGLPNDSSPAARHGTCGHQLSAECLESGTEPHSYVGRVMGFPKEGREDWIEAFPEGTQFEHTETVTEELADACVKYVNFVRQQVSLAADHELIVEQQVPIGHITGEQDARGTSDCILIAGDTLTVIDLKLGLSKVTGYEVVQPAYIDPLTGEDIAPVLQMNLQAALYALGAYEKFGLLHDIQRVRAVIVQPYLNSVSEYECSLDELLALGDWLKARGEATRKNPEFKPSNDNCWFCKARFSCHARNAAALSAAVDGFDDVTTAKPKPLPVHTLGDCYRMVQFVRKWADDVELEAHRRLMAGEKVTDSEGVQYVLKQGRNSPAAWDNNEVVEALVKDLKIKEDIAFTKKLKTPKQLEDLAEKPVALAGRKRKSDEPKKPIGKIKWQKLAEHIKRGSPSPVIAPKSDPRPNYVVPDTTGFESVPPADNSDLFS